MKKQHSNIELVKNFDPTNLAAVAEDLVEDFTWHFINPQLREIQGDYFGIEGLSGFFKRMAGHTAGTFNANPISITPIGDKFS